MSILLVTNSESWSHAGVTLPLRVRNVLFTLSVDEIVPSRKRRHTFVTRFFVSALVFEPLEVMTKLLVANKVLTLLALLIVRVATNF